MVLYALELDTVILSLLRSDQKEQLADAAR
jgi:hypothetical protein